MPNPPVWWNGRHRRLKISRQQCRTGSSPVTGTTGTTIYRGVEQLVARRAHNPEVGGSSPPSATRRSPESHDSGELVIFARSRAFAFRKDKRAIPDALMQAPLQAKPNYTNVMRYCPRLVRQYASKAAAVSGSRFAGCRSLLRTRKFLQNMGFAQKHLSAFILLCFVISRYMMRRSMDHSGENRIQKTQCIPSRCLTTAPPPLLRDPGRAGRGCRSGGLDLPVLQ